VSKLNNTRFLTPTHPLTRMLRTKVLGHDSKPVTSCTNLHSLPICQSHTGVVQIKNCLDGLHVLGFIVSLPCCSSRIRQYLIIWYVLLIRKTIYKEVFSFFKSAQNTTGWTGVNALRSYGHSKVRHKPLGVIIYRLC